MREDPVPVVHRLFPLTGHVALDEEKQLHECRVRGERALGFGHFAELTVERLDRVSGVHHLSDHVAVVEHEAQIVPVAAPTFDHLGVAFTPPR